MTTYVICKNCNGKFKSPIQVENLDTNILQGNITICPLCNKETTYGNENMINE